MTLIEILLKILIVAYASVGVISIIGYWPTIKDLLFNRIKSANVDSYIIWTITAVVSLLYALFILDDWLVRIVMGLNLACCFIIMVLSIRLRK